MLEELKVETADEKLRRHKPDWLQHVTRINKTGCPKSNAELQTKWTKKIWKTFEETIKQSRTRSIKT
jgi:acetoin utilization deacetylase AcuC-like enzyme